MLDLQLQNPSDLLSFSTKWKNIQNKELIQYEDIPKKRQFRNGWIQHQEAIPPYWDI